MKVLIAGLGLIGGSFALALRDHGIAEEILGVESSEEHAAEALQLGLADRIVSFEEGVPEADLVVLATPVDTIPLMAVKALNRAGGRQVVMDMGSIKGELCEVISMHARRGRFVAAHPMWGTEYSGPKAAQRGAFTGRSVVLCDTVRSDKDALTTVEGIFRTLGSPAVYMDPEEHDLHAAYVSHISHVTSFALALTAVCALAEGSLTFSWWGGDARHEATQQAVEAFKAATGIDVQCTYSAWSGWEDKMSQYFASDSAFDVNQINWNWLYSFTNADGSSKFYDLNQVADIIDLSQFDEKALAQCTIDGKLLAIPVAMTGRIFYWNKTTFEKAGLATPITLEELMAAGPIFAEKLGEDYYPLALGAYDKMILMVYYLESVYGKDWVADGQLNYTTEEIAKGLEFIQTLEDNHVIPSSETLTGDGADSLDKNPKWMEGKYAGIFEWDSSASKFEKALSEGQEFIVGNYFADMGEYHGGFTKVSLAFAIANTAADKQAAAQLIEFLLNSDEGAKLMNSQRGIPLSKKANVLCAQEGLLNAKVAEANAKVLDWCSNKLDPKFESSALKNSDGVYYDAMDGLSYKDYSIEEAAEVLYAGITEVLAK